MGRTAGCVTASKVVNLGSRSDANRMNAPLLPICQAQELKDQVTRATCDVKGKRDTEVPEHRGGWVGGGLLLIA